MLTPVKRFPSPGRCAAGTRLAALLAAILLQCAATAPAQEHGLGTKGEENAGPDRQQAPGEEVEPSKAEMRELEANEDPASASRAQRTVERAEQREKEVEVDTSLRTTGIDLYGSLRVRHRYQQGETDWQDGGSRGGVLAEWQFREGSYLVARYEAGFNVLTGLNDLTNPGDKSDEELKDTTFTRLSYLALDSEVLSVLGGKAWSTYYKVAEFTDRFQGTGASASGTYNAQSDGGPTGTGRADDVLQTRFMIDFLSQRYFKPFQLNVQFQSGNKIPFGGGAEYDGAMGISAVMDTHGNLGVGLAYNHARIDLKGNPALRGAGLRGDARAALVGVRAFGSRWYAGILASRLKNHETTDGGVYFDGWGTELYGQYQVFDRLWLVGGYNWLEPDADMVRAGDYRVRYGVLGLRYSFDGFTRMIWANARIDDSVNADGTRGANVYTVGFRWDLTTRGWHLGG